MTFNSFEYAALLAAVVVVYWRLSRRGQNVLLLVASYVFYGWWDWRFLPLIWVSTAVDFVVARLLGVEERGRRRRVLLAVSVAVNLGILGFFKYFGFFVESAVGALGRLGFDVAEPSLQIVLPVGISFYTFQTMSYTIDVYRRRLAPTHDLLSFAVYVAFFPQLVAGPIERAERLLPQFEEARPRPELSRVAAGLQLIFLGLVKKVAIADALAPVVEDVFGRAATAGWMELAVGVLAFTIQIYCDFSGYSSIARGSARLLGIELVRNFEQPYLSRNVTYFWQTWHISLSTWLRDYLYVPLGGNRGGRAATARNLMITMLLGGLWHGAAWTFVVWGGLHGVYLAAHRVMRSRSPGSATAMIGWRDVPAVAGTFALVSLTWIPFRASSFTEAFEYAGGLVSLRPGPMPVDALALLLPAIAVILTIDLAQRRSGRHTVVLTWPVAARGLAYGLGVVAMIVFSGQPAVPFLYFQF
jgi:D-alanyl-lipoteichoic acid acyltransferase DltB (MBOAT superfamily)